MPGTAWKRSLHHPEAYEAVKKKMMKDRHMTEDEAQTMAAKVTNAESFGKKKKDK